MITLLLTAWMAFAEETRVQASVVVKVYQPEAAAESLIDEATKQKGYFSSLSNESITFRIPTPAVEGFLAEVAEEGQVIERSMDASDLSASLAQMRARLKTREQLLDRYFAVLAEANPDAVVSVEREITRLVAEIENLRGNIRYQENLARYAEVRVSFQYQQREAPAADGSSSFAWLNTLNLSDLLYYFRYGYPTAGGKIAADAPDGFAGYRKLRELRAISPDQVMFRVRTMRHKPKADLEFWKESLKKRMQDAGYNFLEESSFERDGLPGYRLELTAPMGEEDYTYLVAVVPNGRKLIIIEAAGEVTRYRAHREAILKAME